jgi:leucyl/phenylalanyl-tRNA--protein transferase
MFALAPDASKIAFVTFVRQIQRWGFELVDCQVYTEHLERFGAVEWPRTRFLAELERLRGSAVRAPVGPWCFDEAAEPSDSDQ